MSITTGLIVLVLFLIVGALIKWRGTSGKQRTDERHQRTGQQSTQFHAVSLKLSSGACDAAKALQGKRFLSNAAPRIPLEDCDAGKCDCRFVHHKDRRSGEDRRYPFFQGYGGGAASGRYEQERRTSRERRDDPPEDPA